MFVEKAAENIQVMHECCGYNLFRVAVLIFVLAIAIFKFNLFLTYFYVNLKATGIGRGCRRGSIRTG